MKKIVSVLIALLLIPLSMSSVQGSVWGDFTGKTTWRVSVAESGCGIDNKQNTEQINIDISNGASADTLLHEQPVSGQLSDNKLIIAAFSFEDSGGNTNIPGATLTFGADCQTFQSKYYWDWYNGPVSGSPTCSGSTQLSAVRTDGGGGCGGSQTKTEEGLKVVESTQLAKIPEVGPSKEVGAVEDEFKYAPVYKDVEDFFNKGGTLSAEDLVNLKNQVKAFQAPVNGNKGDNLDIKLPSGSPIEKLSAPLEQSVSGAKTTVSFIDAKGLNTIRDLSKNSGINDFPPITNPPAPDKFSDPKYFRLDTYDQNENKISPYGEGVFGINVNKADADLGTVKLLRYEEQTRDWKAYQPVLDSCIAETCRFVADPPMNGYFAIVVEQGSSYSSGSNSATITVQQPKATQKTPGFEGLMTISLILILLIKKKL